MNEIKKYISVIGTLILMLASAWVVSGLIYMLFQLPMSFGLAGVLALELTAGALLLKWQGKRITAKLIIGIIFCTTFVLALSVGLVVAVPYLIAYLTDDHLGTSFPWYSGFVFAAYFAGPVALLTGGVWIVMHLREHKRNIRDVRLLSLLLLIGTVVWAVLWTVNRIRICLTYPDAYGHPWHASLVYGLVYFGPWLLLEGGVFAIARHWEKKLTPEDLVVPVSAAGPAPQPAGKGISLRWTDWLIPLLSVAVIAVVFAVFWESGWLVYNIALALCSMASVCLVTGISAWVLYQKFEDGKMLDRLGWLSWLLTVLTVLAAVYWYSWYQENCTVIYNGLLEYAIPGLSVVYFAPMVLGHGTMAVLLRRLAKRADSVPGTPVIGSVLILAVVLCLNGAVMWGQLDSMTYRDEIELRQWKVIYPDTGIEGHFEVYFSPEHHVWIYDTDEEIVGDGIYVTATARWKPFEEIDSSGHYHHFYPDEHVDKLYLYKPGEGYVLALTKDPDTGNWELCE